MLRDVGIVPSNRSVNLHSAGIQYWYADRAAIEPKVPSLIVPHTYVPYIDHFTKFCN